VISKFLLQQNWNVSLQNLSLFTSPHFPFAQAVTSSHTAQACLHDPVLTNTSSFSLCTRWLWTSCISSVACTQLIGSSTALCEHSYTASQPDVACVQAAWSTGKESVDLSKALLPWQMDGVTHKETDCICSIYSMCLSSRRQDTLRSSLKGRWLPTTATQ